MEDQIPVEVNSRRLCLRCRKMFKSSGAGHRFCYKCSKINQSQNGYQVVSIPKEHRHIVKEQE